MTRGSDLDGLSELTQAALDAALAQLRPAARRVADLRTQLAALTPTMAASDLSPADHAQLDRWQAWRAHRTKVLTAELARARAEEEQLKRAARQAFGRREALAALAAAAHAEVRALAQRRSIPDY